MRFDLSSIVTFDHNSFAKKKYQTPAFFCMKLGCLVVTHSTLSPYFNQRQTSFPHGIFLVGTVLLGLAIQDMILPRYVCVHDCIHNAEESYLEGQARGAPCRQEIFRAESSFGVDWNMGVPCVTTPQPHAQKRRRLVLSLCKIVMIKNYYWAQIESHTSGFKAPWWARTTTIQVGAKMRNMRWTYQVALLGLYRGYWWYISSLPCERAAVQRGAPPNSSGNLAQCVCKISLSKKRCGLNKQIW